MSVTVTLPTEYGYVLLAASSTFFLSLLHAINTGRFRHKAGIAYPTCYATEQHAKENQNAFLFNCAQRAQANYLEHQPSVIAALLIAGLQYPLVSAGLGFGWAVNRWIYMVGYTKPSWGAKGAGRLKGVLFFVCQLALYGLAGWTGLQIVKA